MGTQKLLISDLLLFAMYSYNAELRKDPRIARGDRIIGAIEASKISIERHESVPTKAQICTVGIFITLIACILLTLMAIVVAAPLLMPNKNIWSQSFLPATFGYEARGGIMWS